MTPICIPPDRVDAFWPQVDSLIKRAIIRGGLSDFAEIESAVHAGGMLLWIAWDGQKIAAAAITQLGLINGIKCGTIIACAGQEFKRWEHLHFDLEDHFRAEGCSVSRVLGRPGWAKQLDDYRLKAIVLEKAL